MIKKKFDSAIAEKVVRTAHAFDLKMKDSNTRYVIIGGLAAGVWGRPRATKDVDVLILRQDVKDVGDTRSLGEVYGITVKIGDEGIPVDILFPDKHEDFLIEAIRKPAALIDGLPVIDINAFVYLKMKAARRRDENDIMDLASEGADTIKIADYLRRNAPDKVEDFTQLVEEAKLRP
jgi:hypothetical protein